MSSNSVCNHTRDKQIGLPLRVCYHSYDYRPNWTPLSPITIINSAPDTCGIAARAIAARVVWPATTFGTFG